MCWRVAFSYFPCRRVFAATSTINVVLFSRVALFLENFFVSVFVRVHVVKGQWTLLPEVNYVCSPDYLVRFTRLCLSRASSCRVLLSNRTNMQ